MDQEKTHILSFKTQLIIMGILIILTLLAVGVTKINLGSAAVIVILSIAAIKTFLVMSYYMHLKFDKPFYRIMVTLLFVLFLAVLLVTFLDYIYR